MQFIVGLGNPGPDYQNTRHNIGFRVVEELSRRWKIPLRLANGLARWGRGKFRALDVALAQPYTYMNLSGRAVSKLLANLSLEPSALLVVHDDMDLPLGRMKFVAKGGSGGHRGISSLIFSLGTNEFLRLKVGIDHPRHGELVESYVLSPCYPEEAEIYPQVITRAAGAVEVLLTDGLSQAMSMFHGPLRP